MNRQHPISTTILRILITHTTFAVTVRKMPQQRQTIGYHYDAFTHSHYSYILFRLDGSKNVTETETQYIQPPSLSISHGGREPSYLKPSKSGHQSQKSYTGRIQVVLGA